MAEIRRRGRPEGSTNRYTREAIEKARQTGLLPHEILLSMARGEPQVEYDVDPISGRTVERLVPLDIEQRKDAAKAAAPYYAPKISTVEVIKNVDDAELDFIIAELAAQTGISVGTSGEAAEDTQGDGAPGSSTPRRRVQLLDDR